MTEVVIQVDTDEVQVRIAQVSRDRKVVSKCEDHALPYFRLGAKQNL